MMRQLEVDENVRNKPSFKYANWMAIIGVQKIAGP